MKNEIQIFQNEEFGAIRTTSDEQGNPLFCLKDVCEVLALVTTQVVRRLSDDVFSKHPILDKLGRRQQAIFVNEDGLYDTILESRKPQARGFRKWVTSEVLPAIRKQGGYMMAGADESNEVIMARALQIAQATIERRDAEIAILKPKADYVDEVLDAVTCFTTTQIAKGLNTTAYVLNRMLCARHVQYAQSGQYLLYANYARRGLAKNRIHTYYDTRGEVHTKSTLVWTERGRQFIYQLFNYKKAI